MVTVGLLAALLASCSAVTLSKPPDGGGDDGGPVLPDGGADAGLPPSDGGLPLEQACGVLNGERCAYLQRCGLVGESVGELLRCQSELLATWCGPSTWPARVVSSVGTLRYDPLLAQDCAAAFATRACAEFETLPDSCGTFLKPAANLRQACYGGFQECIEGVCRGAACPRTCQARGVAGEVCRQDSDCVARLFCRPSTTSPGIGTCTAYAGIDEPCDTDTRCLEGLWCNSSQCRQLPMAGSACLYGRCDDVSYCDAALDGGTCVPRKNRGAGCAPGQCLPELVCGALSSVCEPKLLEQAGTPCTWEQTCPTGTVCVGWTQGAPGSCEPPHGEGDGCTHHADCLAHLACLDADGGRTCQRRLDAGAACDDARACGLQATCTRGHCVELREPGQSCDEAGACLWGPCVDAGTAGFRCTGPLGPGADCTRAADCTSGRCETGKCLAPCAP